MTKQYTQQYPSQYFFRALHCACILSASLLAPATFADTELTPFEVEELIVTAAKREQLLKDFSGSISVVKTDSMNPGSSLSDIANQVPGLSVIDNGPGSVTSIIMRGLRMDSVNSKDFIGDGSTVAAYVDNIPLQGFFVPPSFSLKDLQQVEVLRGPQGTLYGNASIGGLIRYITAKPDLTKNSTSLTAGVSQTKESHGLNYDTDLVINTPFIENELGARVLLAKKENQGFIDNSEYLLSGPEKDINSDRADQVRAALLWKPNADFSLSGSYEYQKKHVDDRQASNETFTGDKYGASNRYAQPMNGVLRLASIDAIYQLEWTSVTTSVNQSKYVTDSIADQTDYLLTNYSSTYGGFADFTAYTKNDAEVVKDSAEVRFVSPDDQSLRWLAGVFFTDDDLDVVIADRVPGFAAYANEDRPDDLDYYYTQKEKLSEQSIYAEVIYDLTPRWEISLGKRYFREEDKLEACDLFFPTTDDYEGTDYPVNCFSGKDKQSESLGKFASKYKITNHKSIYFTVAEGFRRGGANILPTNAIANRNYKPDTSVNYEIGTHSDFAQGKIRFNAAFFFIDWKDVQVESLSAEGYGIFANAGAARSRGVELDGSFQLTQNWSTVIGYSSADAEISEDSADIDGYGSSVIVGDRLPGSPREQWNLGLNYRRTINLATWSASVNYAENSGIITAPNDSFFYYSKLAGYGVVNANVGAALHNWHFSVYANNLTNERAITKTRTPELYGEQGRFEYITRPRTLGVSVNYTF